MTLIKDLIYLQPTGPDAIAAARWRNVVHDPRAVHPQVSDVGWDLSPDAIGTWTHDQTQETHPYRPPLEVHTFTATAGATDPGVPYIVGPTMDWQAINSDVGRVYLAVKVRASGGMVGERVDLRIMGPRGAAPVDPDPGLRHQLTPDWAWAMTAFTPEPLVRAAGPDHRIRLGIVLLNGATIDPGGTVYVAGWAIVTHPGGSAEGMPAGLTDAEAVYFDGDTPAGGRVPAAPGRTWAPATWEGEHHLSPSIRPKLVHSPFIGPVLGVTINRGGTPSAATLEPSVGTCQVRLDTLTAGSFQLGESYAVKTALQDQGVDLGPPGASLFTGQLVDIQVTRDLDPATGTATSVTTLYLADHHRDLANTKRYGLVTPSGLAQRTHDHVAQLMESAPGVDHRLQVALRRVTTGHQSTVYESALTNHLTLTSTGARAGWAVDRDNKLSMSAGLVPDITADTIRTTQVQLTDGSTPTVPEHTAYPYVGTASSWHSNQAVTSVTLVNHGRKFDSSGDPVADDVTYEHTDTTRAGQWGLRREALDSCLYSDNAATQLAEFYTQRSDPALRPRWVRLNAGLYGMPADLDLLDTVTVTQAGSHYLMYVAAITHTMTATSWLVDYTLADTGMPPVHPARPDELHPSEQLHPAMNLYPRG